MMHSNKLSIKDELPHVPKAFGISLWNKKLPFYLLPLPKRFYD
jgi:hypothetical protein